MSTRYYEKDGKQYVSVTTVLSLLDKWGLKEWAAKLAAEYMARKILDMPISWAEKLWPQAVDMAKTEHKRVAAAAADRGTRIHSECERYLQTINKGEEIELSDEIKPFKEWCEKHQVIPIDIEQTVYGKDYAGTLDLSCIINKFWDKSKERVLAVCDIKTSPRYYNEHGYQLAAYCDAWRKERKSEEIYGFPPNTIPFTGVIRINPETGKVNYKNFTPTYNRDLEVFNHLNAVWNLTRRKKDE